MQTFTDVARAASILRQGGVVAFPTETVYGLGADALNRGAVGRVFALKGRPSHNPLIVHVTGRDMVERVASAWPAEAEKLARAFWPGPLSIILPRRPELPDTVTAGGPTVAVRSPDHPLALALLFEFRGPLVGPSANLSGRVSPTTAAHVRESFADSDVHILDGGPCTTGIESTVLALSGEVTGGGPHRILRPGVISARDIAAVLGAPVEDAPATPRPAWPMTPLASPGMLASHYAPLAATALFTDADWPEVAGRASGGGGPVAVLTHNPRELPAPNLVIRLPADARGYAAAMYAALREADAVSPALIAVERPPSNPSDADAPIWAAISDRLARAAAPRSPWS